MKIRIDLRWWKNFKKKVKKYFGEVEVSDGRKKKHYRLNKLVTEPAKEESGFNKYKNYVLNNPVSAIIALIPHLVIFLVGSVVTQTIGETLVEQGMWNPAPLMELAILIATGAGFIMSLTKRMGEDNGTTF